MTAAGAAAGAAAAAAVAAAAAANAATSAGALAGDRLGGAMDSAAGPVAPRFYTTTRPPPIESLALAYFTPIMAPTPVGTRLPQPGATEDVISGFLRIEAGGGVQRPDGLLWDMSVILHAYVPNTQEAMGEHLIGEAVAWGSNAQGTTTELANGDKWYVTYSRVSGMPARKADPMVPLTRYRAMVTWRMPGITLRPGQTFARYNPPAPSMPPTRGVAASNAPRPSRRR